ncbi:RNA-directed DNA polymerase [Rhodocytophaga rosea]|uniref:RNA-directed DNA polymerase n=1 Tax=Rhodocytophaga rosea TaxID=2704465 RepID=A0A6C0GND6_9BACT|nr:reverse transcriptase family protein [Rhodocytophaga rosea]QHT69447.1 RNA-directed DNA polymerase [Rhodocytophaga rosea]
MQLTPSTTENWRARLQRLGRDYFVIEEMIRLGFLDLSQQQYKTLQDSYTRLNEINGELQKLNIELKGTEDITPLLKEIRKNRIERVRAKRAIRKVEKARVSQAKKAEIALQKQKTPYHLGEGVSKGLRFDETDTEKLSQAGLPVLHTLEDLAQFSKLEMKQWVWLSYHRRVAGIDHYTRFQIPKKKGGLRNIASPKKTLRIAQQWILENILNKRPIHPNAMAFLPGKNIRHNAEKHTGKHTVVRVDLKDFFPSVKFPRVKGLFKSWGYSEGIATVLALVCTDATRIGASLDGKAYFVALGERFLPQGACTSPAITNILCGDTGYLDHRLTRLGEKLDWTYTRYADDLVFSTNITEDNLKSLLGLMNKIIKDEGFEINQEKTSVMRQHQRQTVTGAVVNGTEPRVSREDIRRFRAFLHQMEKNGSAAMSQKLGKDAERYAQGYWAFIHMVQPTQAEKFLNQYSWLKKK